MARRGWSCTRRRRRCCTRRQQQVRKAASHARPESACRMQMQLVPDICNLLPHAIQRPTGAASVAARRARCLPSLRRRRQLRPTASLSSCPKPGMRQAASTWWPCARAMAATASTLMQQSRAQWCCTGASMTGRRRPWTSCLQARTRCGHLETAVEAAGTGSHSGAGRRSALHAHRTSAGMPCTRALLRLTRPHARMHACIAPRAAQRAGAQVDDKAVQTQFADGRHVALRFPASQAPERIVFVLKETQPENWINNGNCYAVQVRGLHAVFARKAQRECCSSAARELRATTACCLARLRARSSSRRASTRWLTACWRARATRRTGASRTALCWRASCWTASRRRVRLRLVPRVCCSRAG